MAAAHKKVIVRLFNADTVSGYLPSSGFVDAGQVDLLDPSGKIISILLNNIKMISYVKDFNFSDPVDPERLGRRTFAGRPRGMGLWVQVAFRDGDVLEGLAAPDISFVDSMVSDSGLMLVPPDTRSNTQRVYVPRAALAALDFLGLILSASKRKATARPAVEMQPGLFGES